MTEKSTSGRTKRFCAALLSGCLKSKTREAVASLPRARIQKRLVTVAAAAFTALAAATATVSTIATTTTATATATTTVASTAAAATTAIAAATARRTLFTRTGDVHGEVTAADVLAMQALNGLLSRFGAGHGDEREAPGLAGLAVEHEVNFHDRAERGEGVLQVVLGRGEREVPDEQFVVP